MFLDEHFITYIERLIGKDKLPTRLPKAAYDELMYIWEHKIKRQFESERSEIATLIPHPVAKAIDSPFKIRKVFGKGLGSKNGSKQLTGDLMRFSSYV